MKKGIIFLTLLTVIISGCNVGQASYTQDQVMFMFSELQLDVTRTFGCGIELAPREREISIVAQTGDNFLAREIASEIVEVQDPECRQMLQREGYTDFALGLLYDNQLQEDTGQPLIVFGDPEPQCGDTTDLKCDGLCPIGEVCGINAEGNCACKEDPNHEPINENTGVEVGPMCIQGEECGQKSRVSVSTTACNGYEAEIYNGGQLSGGPGKGGPLHDAKESVMPDITCHCSPKDNNCNPKEYYKADFVSCETSNRKSVLTLDITGCCNCFGRAGAETYVTSDNPTGEIIEINNQCTGKLISSSKKKIADFTKTYSPHMSISQVEANMKKINPSFFNTNTPDCGQNLEEVNVPECKTSVCDETTAECKAEYTENSRGCVVQKTGERTLSSGNIQYTFTKYARIGWMCECKDK